MGYIGMCRCEGYGFQAVQSRIGYINLSVWVQNRVSFFTKLTIWLKILSRLRKPVIATQKYKKKIKSESLDLRKSASTVSIDGGFGEFTLVYVSKTQLNQLWYKLRVPGSQRHIPTQKFPKYPPPGLEKHAFSLIILKNYDEFLSNQAETKQTASKGVLKQKQRELLEVKFHK